MSLWLVGGMDPTGGAGVLRDAWTAEAVGWHPVHVLVSALTDQGRGRVRVWPTDAARFASMLASAPAPTAIKIGLVPVGLVAPLRAVIERVGVPVVLDPVLRASEGGGLGATVAALTRLASGLELVTPNLPEAQALLGAEESFEVEDVGALGRLRDRLGGAGVLLKGGHGTGDRVVDRLDHRGGSEAFDRPRVPGADVRGTGCALATAIAVGRSRGQPLMDAVADAIAWLDDARTHAGPGPDGRPHLP